jgi:hypothetical protein
VKTQLQLINIIIIIIIIITIIIIAINLLSSQMETTIPLWAIGIKCKQIFIFKKIYKE